MNDDTATTIVVYNSRWEAERDKYLMENPEMVLYFIVGTIILVGIILLIDKIRMSFKIRKKYRRFN